MGTVARVATAGHPEPPHSVLPGGGRSSLRGSPRKDKREAGAEVRIFRPDPAAVRAEDHLADRQSEPAAGAVGAAAVRSVFLEYLRQMLGRNARAGIADVDAIRIGLAEPGAPRLVVRRGCPVGPASIPEIRPAAELDLSASRRELAGVLQNVDQHLLHLAGLDQERPGLAIQVDRDGDPLAVGQWTDFMQRLLRALPDIRGAQLRRALDLGPDAHLEHRRGHAAEPFNTVLHAPQNFFLLLALRAHRPAQKQPAISLGGHQRRAKIMHRAGQEVGAVLVVSLDSQVRLNQALQQVVTVGAQRICRQRPLLRGHRRQLQEGRQTRASHGFQQNRRCRDCLRRVPAVRNMIAMHHEQMPRPRRIHVRRRSGSAVVVPDVQVSMPRPVRRRCHCQLPVQAGKLVQDIVAELAEFLILRHQDDMHRVV